MKDDLEFATVIRVYDPPLNSDLLGGKATAARYADVQVRWDFTCDADRDDFGSVGWYDDVANRFEVEADGCVSAPGG